MQTLLLARHGEVDDATIDLETELVCGAVHDVRIVGGSDRRIRLTEHVDLIHTAVPGYRPLRLSDSSLK